MRAIKNGYEWVVNIGFEEAVKGIFLFIERYNLKIEKIVKNDEVFHIRVLTQLPSYKLIWNRQPAIIEWIVKKNASLKAVVTILFRLKISHRVLFWLVIVVLSLYPFYRYFYPLENSFGNFLYVAFAISIMFCCLILFPKIDTEETVNSFCKLLMIPPEPVEEPLIYPDMFFLLLYLTSVAVTGLTQIFLKENILLVPFFILLGIFIVLLFKFSLSVEGFIQRLMLCIVHSVIVAVVMSFLLFPTINSFLPDYKKVFLSSLNLFKGEVEPSLIKSIAIKSLIKFLIPFAFIYLTIFYILIRIIAFIPELNDAILKQINPAENSSAFHAHSNVGMFFKFSILTIWVSLSIGIIYGLCSSFSLLELSLFSKTVIFNDSYAAIKLFDDLRALMTVFLFDVLSQKSILTILRISIVICFMPLILFIIYPFIRRFRYSLRVNKLVSIQGLSTSSVLNIKLEKIAQHFGVEKPGIIMIQDRKKDIYAFQKGIFRRKSYIVITKGCLEIEESALEALLAHEIGHIKSHLAKWDLYNIISEFSFFGTGFLSTLISSYEREFGADRFAVEWLSCSGMQVKNFVDALKEISLEKQLENEFL